MPDEHSFKFKIFGIYWAERLPKPSFKSLDFVRSERTAIKSRLGLPITYNDMRFSLTPEGKKRADLAFITYFIRERDRDAHNAPNGSKLYYRYLYLCYLPELTYIKSRASKEEYDGYALQWGYQQSLNPSFIELIHGTDVNSALFAIENID